MLVVAALGLPINDLFRYALLLLAALTIFAGDVSADARAWLKAFAVVALAVLGQALWPAPRIDEGHNVFILDRPSGGELQRELPPDVFRVMEAEFDTRYPRERRCAKDQPGCWRLGGFPETLYAFSADGIYDRGPYSRRVTTIDFSDPVWLRLGFINDRDYNWFGASDVQREQRERRWWVLLHPWRIVMPYFVVYRFPPEFTGSRLCWQGKLLWEREGGRFATLTNVEWACRSIEAADIGRRIFGVSIATPLAMSLQAPLAVQLHRLVAPALALAAVGAVLMLLLRWERRRLVLPFVFTGLALVVVFCNDASFLGGWRPFEGGDDGLFYESVGRLIVQHLLAGDFARALEGGESVFFYGAPGLRYFRALERFIFGDSFLGYLSLVLVLPFLVFLAFRRFLSVRAALALTFMFLAIPVGALFGTSFFHYAKWAARGFADPAAAILFLGGFVMLVGRTAAGPDARFAPAFGAGLLFALALWMRPNLAPAAGILLGGAGLAALWQWQLWRVAGLCIGFLPVLGMALHNWYFGGVFVLFSSNATIAEAIPMPPSAYIAAVGELLRLDFAGEHVRRGLLQIGRWLAGPSESFWMVPLHAAAVVVLFRVGLQRGYDPWLRLTAWATLAQHPVALFYLSYDRYYYLAWFLTLLVCVVWIRDEGLDLLRRWFPAAHARLTDSKRFTSVLDWWMRATGLAPDKRA